jgi:hypothetical protein
MPESPRWLYSNKNKPKEAQTALFKIYNGNPEWIEFEMKELAAVALDQQAHGGSQFYQFIFQKIFILKHIFFISF